MGTLWFADLQLRPTCAAIQSNRSAAWSGSQTVINVIRAWSGGTRVVPVWARRLHQFGL
jgi:hypothetical protein